MCNLQCIRVNKAQQTLGETVRHDGTARVVTRYRMHKTGQIHKKTYDKNTTDKRASSFKEVVPLPRDANKKRRTFISKL